MNERVLLREQTIGAPMLNVTILAVLLTGVAACKQPTTIEDDYPRRRSEASTGTSVAANGPLTTVQATTCPGVNTPPRSGAVSSGVGLALHYPKIG